VSLTVSVEWAAVARASGRKSPAPRRSIPLLTTIERWPDDTARKEDVVSRSLNKVTLIGNLGSDPEVRATPGGGRVAQFSLATSRTWNDQSGTKQEKTEWHRCVVWNTKGSQLADIVERMDEKWEGAQEMTSTEEEGAPPKKR